MNRPEVFLYAEDDQAYADILRCILAQGGEERTIIHVPNGEEAISYLKGENHYANRDIYPLPGVALLDLKMPGLGGFDVLQWIRQQPQFCHLPVVVLTSSDEMRDIQKAYQLGANSFLLKPLHLAELKGMLKMLDEYWFKFNVTLERKPASFSPKRPFGF